ncbi:MAG: fabH [Chlamydiales bacterium]|jgi:3-oxoacyl-[acyl-carrier-protein] synthase-3|nr:fabH [Chlamydiales bacterium]
MKLKARITAFGSYLPKAVLTNFDLEKMVATTDEWIVSRSGIRERRIASQSETTFSMGALAAEEALSNRGLEASAIDLILLATMTPDCLTPATACLIQNELKATQAAAMDLSAACSGFLYGLATAKAFIESGMSKRILLICSEKMSAVIDYTDRTTCCLFGDGAGAVLIEAEGPGLAVEQICLGADGEQAKLLHVPAVGSLYPPSDLESSPSRYLTMSGSEVFKHAVRRMESAAKQCLDLAGLQEEDVDWLVPHQANIRIIDALAKRFRIPSERIVKTLEKYGNTSASTIPIALAELAKGRDFAEGETILTASFGGGLTYASALLKKIL